MDTGEYLAFLLLIVFGIMLFPYVQNEINAVDTSSWTFVGHETVANFLPAIPYIFLAILVVAPTYLILKRGAK